MAGFPSLTVRWRTFSTWNRVRNRCCSSRWWKRFVCRGGGGWGSQGVQTPLPSHQQNDPWDLRKFELFGWTKSVGVAAVNRQPIALDPSSENLAPPLFVRHSSYAFPADDDRGCLLFLLPPAYVANIENVRCETGKSKGHSHSTLGSVGARCVSLFLRRAMPILTGGFQQSVLSALEIFLSMRYINLHFTYLLTYNNILCCMCWDQGLCLVRYHLIPRRSFLQALQWLVFIAV